MWGRRACLAAVGGAVGFGGQSAFLPVRCEEGAGAGAGLGTGFFGFFENLVSSSSSSSMPGSVRDLSPDERARMRDEFFKYTPPFPVNPDNGIVFFELGFDGKSVGRVEFEVFDDSSPLLATNFKALSQGFMWGYPIATKKNTYRHDKLRKFLRYKNTLFHKVQPGYLCLGGDNERFDGTGGEAFNGCNMRDCFRGKGGRLPGPGCVASVRHAKQVNRSQFLITFRAMPHLEGQNSCFAQVVKGWEVMQEVEKLGTPSGHPRAEVSVLDCGIVKQKTGELYDHEDPLAMKKLRKGAAEEEKAHGAVGLTQVNANINNEHWSRDDKYRGNHPSTYDTRGSMEGKKSVAELSSDPSVCC